MIERFQKFYGQPVISSTLATTFVYAPMDSQIGSIIIWALVDLGTATFNIRVNGTPLFAGGSRPTITAGGDGYVIVNDLSESVNLKDIVTLDVEDTGGAGLSRLAFQVNFFLSLGTSVTSNSVGIGSKTFSTQIGLPHAVGSRVRIAQTSNPTVNYMEGIVTSYIGTSIIVTTDIAEGSGTHTDWTFSIAGEQGPEGPPGASGGTVDTIVEGTGINVDATDPANPIVDVDTTVISTKSYAESLVVGLWDDRGNYNASSTNHFPASGGSGSAGAILKGDIWTISVIAASGPLLGFPVGSTVRALVDTPGQTAGNWDVLNVGIGYVPENQANKSTTLSADQASNTKYSTPKSIYDWAVGLFAASATEVFTNKTFDSEATGNVFGAVEKIWIPAAGTNGTTPAPVWDLPASGAPTATDVTGTNIHKGVLSFADSGLQTAQMTLLLPSDWSGAIDIKLIWYTTATSGNCKWQVSTAFTDTGASATDDPSFNTAQTVTTAAPGAGSRITSSSIASLTLTGSAAGALMHIKVGRDGTDGSDTIGAAALFVGAEITMRRTV
jgi:hypothetical protein